MRLAPFALLLAAVSGLALAGPAGAAETGPQPVTAAIATFKLGDLTLTALRDAEFVAPNDAKIFGFGQEPAAIDKVLVANGAPAGSIRVSVDALLVRLPGHLALLDTGFGVNNKGVIIASLAKAGVAPDAITDVLITHSHGDHVGGLLGADGKSIFPKAAIHMAAKEWASVQAQPELAKFVAAIGPQVQTFDGDALILPGITSVTIAGHTPGHTGYEITSKGQSLLDIGDTAHSSILSLARPDWAMGFDSDKAVGAASRRATLARLAQRHELVFAPHFPFPGVGRVVAKGDGFTWAPDKALKVQ